MDTVSCILGFTYDYGRKLAATLWLTVPCTVSGGRAEFTRASTRKALVQSQVPNRSEKNVDNFHSSSKYKHFPILDQNSNQNQNGGELGKATDSFPDYYSSGTIILGYVLVESFNVGQTALEPEYC